MDSELLSLAERISVLALDYAIDIVGAIVLLVAGWLAARWIKRMLRRALARLPAIDPTLSAVLSNLAYYGVLVLVLVAVLAHFGVQTASILAVLGTAGLAIGLALQGTLSNIAAGLMLLFLRPFKVGDYIDAEGLAGTVREIGLFTTELTTSDGVYQSVPNSNIWNRSILNYSRLPTRRVDLVLRISYGDDIDRAMNALMDLMSQDEKVLSEPAPQVWLGELSDSAVALNLRCWTKADDSWTYRYELTRAAKDCVEAAGCTIPLPQQEVRLVGAS